MDAYISSHGRQRDLNFQRIAAAPPTPAATAAASINVLSIIPPYPPQGQPVRPLPNNTFSM